ncbi:PH domain-containing protein [Allokutzneria multivorans]|uniref:PH domain-containing protein n=2 Tax=Allokutzneria multivorans TaxID=1142134 RepID=A0ABP7S1L2_9PSEU
MTAAMSDAVTELVIRPRKVRRVAPVLAVALVAVFVVVGLLLGNTPTGAYFRVADQIAMAGIGVALAGAALLFTRPRVRADAEGIEVRNIVVTHRFPWALVREVNFPDGSAWARLELPDDEYVPVMAIQSTDSRHAVDAMRELRAMHASQTQQDTK